MNINIKKIFFCCVFVASFFIVSCGKNKNVDTIDTVDNMAKVDNIYDIDNNKKETKIMTTIFPIYDIIKEITNGIKEVKVDLLIDKGIDLHSYNATSKDIINISNSDIFVYVGGESDNWVNDIFTSMKIDEDKKVNLMKIINETYVGQIKEEEEKEGMEKEEEEEKETEEKEYDEHIWLSLKNAKYITLILSDKIKNLLSDEEKNVLEKNIANYLNELEKLDVEYEQCIKEAKEKNKTEVFLFADRFPFLYLVKDYNLDYFAAFKGCSAESEASFKTITFLSNKCKELNLKYVFVLEGSDKKIAETIIKNANENIKILTLDSMQNKTRKSIEDGETYINIMKKNLEVIRKYFE